MGTELGATASVFPSDSLTKQFLAGKAEARTSPRSRPNRRGVRRHGRHRPRDAGAAHRLPVESGQREAGSRGRRDRGRASRRREQRELVVPRPQHRRPRPRRETHGARNLGRRLARLASDPPLDAHERTHDEAHQGGVASWRSLAVPCIGMGFAPPTRGPSVRTFNRNSRVGAARRRPRYLCSPETAAAAALHGEIRTRGISGSSRL